MIYHYHFMPCRKKRKIDKLSSDHEASHWTASNFESPCKPRVFIDIHKIRIRGWASVSIDVSTP